MFVAERMANAVNSKCAAVYLSPSTYEYAVKFCFYADHAAVIDIGLYVRTEVSCTVYTTHVVCTSPWYGELVSLILLAVVAVFE